MMVLSHHTDFNWITRSFQPEDLTAAIESAGLRNLARIEGNCQDTEMSQPLLCHSEAAKATGVVTKGTCLPP